ncbi:MAG TPA: sugar dehydrogenase complex small subunit [Burkholderiaceae bacterium]|nr:sugar dehydrogenase complex small subunit [Burkholderiaceae bacterium]
MTDLSRNQTSPGKPIDTRRRQVLGALLSAYTATLIPWAMAQPVRDDEEGVFLALSAILVGRESLNSGLARRLHDGLIDQDAGFPKGASALLSLIDEEHIDPMMLQARLDAAYPALAPLPRRIVTAWYVGVVGEGVAARCVAYEDSLMSEVVKDKLVPPTYAYGAYGSWEDKPA